MNHRRKQAGILTIAMALACITTANAQAQSDVRMQVSGQETYVGMPVTLQIQVENVSTTEPPEFPKIDGLDIRPAGSPSRSSRVTIINGRRTQSNSVVYTYQFTPRREGTFEIPAITVKTADGPRRTRPFRISATTSETGDLMFAEVAGQKERLYVGQPIDLTLRIWLKPFQDQEHNVTISAADMWRMIAGRTEWGAFAKTLEKLDSEGRTIRGQEVLRADNQGVERSYYLYEIVATYYPKRAGQIEVEDVQIVAQYPTSLGRSRDPFESFFGGSPMGSMFEDDFFKGRSGSPFGRTLTVTGSRPIVVTPKVAPIDVTPIPTDGRPADYRGAVGQYQMITQATPAQVKAGDPVTLKIGIRGTGPMELVQAPPLAELPTLTANFKVSDEPLAGVVQDDIKVFTTTIRPRNENVTSVPSIPFSFFDPEIEEFVTLESEPVSIEVSKAEKLALDSIVGTAGERKPGSPKTNAINQGPELNNYEETDLLANQSASPELRVWLGWFLIPAGMLGLGLVFRNSKEWYSQVGTRSVLGRIKRACDAREVAKSVLALISGKLGQKTDNLTRREAIQEISGLMDSTTTERLSRFLIDCENSAFRGDESVSLQQTKQTAIQLVSKLARLKQNVSLKPKAQPPWRTVVAAALAVAIISVTGVSLFSAFSTAKNQTGDISINSRQTVELNDAQKAILLKEASSQYRHAIETKVIDVAESNLAFVNAAQKYQTLVDSGVHNSRLYFNLGNAYLQSDSIGRAIANYERALKLRPFDFKVRQNLGFAIALVGQQTGKENSASGLTPDLLMRWVTELPTNVWLTFLATGWIGICVSVWIRFSQPRFRVRYLAVPALVLFIAGNGLIMWTATMKNDYPAAVVVATDIPVYQGSNETFPLVSNVDVAEGERVQVIQRRGDWLQIRSSTGNQGWTKADLLEQV